MPGYLTSESEPTSKPFPREKEKLVDALMDASVAANRECELHAARAIACELDGSQGRASEEKRKAVRALMLGKSLAEIGGRALKHPFDDCSALVLQAEAVRQVARLFAIPVAFEAPPVTYEAVGRLSDGGSFTVPATWPSYAHMNKDGKVIVTNMMTPPDAEHMCVGRVVSVDAEPGTVDAVTYEAVGRLSDGGSFTVPATRLRFPRA